MTSTQKRTRVAGMLLGLLLVGQPSGDDVFLVAIDIGHTPDNPGALSARGATEYEFNKAIAEVVYREINAQEGLRAFIVDPTGADDTLSERTKIARERSADLFISIHHDSVQPHYLSEWTYNGATHHYSDHFEGYSIFVSNRTEHAERNILFASLVGERLRELGLTPTLHHAEPIEGENRELLDEELGVHEFGELRVLRTATMPAILFECGVIVNRKEELLVSSPTFRTEIAQAFVHAIRRYREATLPAETE